MPRSFPRWLIVLIGLVIIFVVGSVALFSLNIMNRAAVNTTATSQHALAIPSSTLTVTAHANGTTSGTLLTPTAVSSTKTVFLILMENHNWSDIKNNPSASYINNTLLPMASYTEQYFNPAGIHPSEPNYLWLEAGTNFGILNDADPSANHQSTTLHLVTPPLWTAWGRVFSAQHPTVRRLPYA